MVQNRTHEGREYLRVRLAGRVMVKPVSREEYARGKGLLPGPVGEGGRGDSAKGDVLEDRLMRIEEKLDRILQKLDLEVAMEGPAIRGTACDISGAGVNLTLEAPVDVGQLILMSLSIPGFSVGTLHAYGEVVRVTSGQEKEPHAFDTAVRFLTLDEKERDMLISYTFHRQRQEIRRTGGHHGKSG